jgi:hypothetical protein
MIAVQVNHCCPPELLPPHAQHLAFSSMDHEGSPRSLGSPASGSASPPSSVSGEQLGLEGKPAVDNGAGGFAGANGTPRGPAWARRHRGGRAPAASRRVPAFPPPGPRAVRGRRPRTAALRRFMPLAPHLLSPSQPSAVFGAHMCHSVPLELDVPTGLVEEEAPVMPVPPPAPGAASPTAAGPSCAAAAAAPEPLLFLQGKACGTHKVKGRLRAPGGAFTASFDHAPGCPLGTSYRLFSGGRCHSSFKVGGAKVTVLRGEACEWGVGRVPHRAGRGAGRGAISGAALCRRSACPPRSLPLTPPTRAPPPLFSFPPGIKVQLRGLPYVGIIIAGDFEGRAYRVLQHMPGRRSERLLAAASPSPAGPGLTRLRVSAGVDVAFIVALAALVAEAAAHGSSSCSGAGAATSSSGSSSAAGLLAHAQLMQAAAAAAGGGGGRPGRAPPVGSPAWSPQSSGTSRTGSGSSGGLPGGAAAALRAAANAAAAAQGRPVLWAAGGVADMGGMRRFAPVPSDPFAHSTLPLMPAAAPRLSVTPPAGGAFFPSAPSPLSPHLAPAASPPGLLLQPRPLHAGAPSGGRLRAPGASPLMVQLEQVQLLQALQNQEAARLQHELQRLTLMQRAYGAAPPAPQPGAGPFSGPVLSPRGSGGPGPVSQPLLPILSAPGNVASDPAAAAFWSPQSPQGPDYGMW